MRIIKGLLVLLFACSVLGLITGYFFYQQLESKLPDIAVLREIKYKQPLSVYSQDGLLIEQFGEKIRIPISIANTPEQLINAFISAEDSNFFTHIGIDFKGLARAVMQLILTGKKKQGGSTITMQVARNFLLNKQKTYVRKLKEIILSLRMEQAFSKNAILEMYLNKIYLGQRAYGIAAAAKIYYNRPLSQLTLAELSMMAGLPKAPSSYNPISNPERALLRRNYVLKRMLNLRYIQQVEYDTAIKAPITANTYTTQREMYAPYIAEMVRNDIIRLYGEEAAYSSGFKVYTTLKSDLQNTAVNVLRANLHKFDERHSYRVNKKQQISLALSDNTGATYLAQVIQINAEYLTAKLKDTTTPIKLLWKNSPWSTKYNLTTQKKEKINAYLDIIDLYDTIRIRQVNQSWRLAQIPEAEGAFVAIDPKSGSILALTGGYAYFNNQYNHATQAKRQPGSGFKPIIYTSALESGYTPASIINDAPIISTAKENTWRPENYNDKFHGPTNIRTALRNSYNLIAIRLTRAIGIATITDTALRFGFLEQQLPQKLSLALGSGYASPLQMARMYAVFANGGYLINPYYIERIESSNGTILFQAKPLTACAECENNVAPRIISAQINFLMNSLLRDVVQRGTATKAKVLKRTDLAGKTGTTNDQKDAWFNGFTPDIVGIAWIGKDNSKSLGQWETGSKAALPVWIDFMRYALQGKMQQEPLMPEGINKVLIDPETGLLAREESTHAIWEYFSDESTPTQLAPYNKQQSYLTEQKDEQEEAPKILF